VRLLVALLLAAQVARADDFGEIQRLAKSLAGAEGVESPLARCGDMGMRESDLLCPAFLGAALVSAAVERPERTERMLPVLDALIRRALSASAQGTFLSTGVTRVLDRHLPRSVLYRGLVLLLLAGRERLEPGSRWTPLFDALAGSLSNELAKSRAGWLPTYDTTIWPCDHAPAASALILHGILRSDGSSKQAGDEMVKRLLELVSRPQGFPTTVNADGTIADGGLRGTTWAWTAGFLLPGAPEAARTFARLFFRRFCDRALGFGACREWVDGKKHADDVVSGPSFLGYSAGPTGLAFAAARALEDSSWSDTLEDAGTFGGLDELHRRPTEFPLQNAISRWGRTARSWLPTPVR
jgi:hypothetical protein